MSNQYNSVIYFLCFIKGCTLKAVSNYGNWARVALNSPVTRNLGTTTLTANRLVRSWSSSVTSDLLPAPSDSLESILYLFYWINSILPVRHSTHPVQMEREGDRPLHLRICSDGSAKRKTTRHHFGSSTYSSLLGKGHYQIHMKMNRSYMLQRSCNQIKHLHLKACCFKSSTSLLFF